MAFELSAQDLQWVLEGASAEALLLFSKLVKCFSSQPSPQGWSCVWIVPEQEVLGLWLSLLGKGVAGGSQLTSLLMPEDLSSLLSAGRWGR